MTGLRAIPLAGLLLLAGSSPSFSASPPALGLDIVVRVATCDGKPVRSRRWVTEHVDAARQIFGAHGIDLRTRVEAFVPARCELVTRAHRDGLAPHAPRGQVVVLVVRRAQDVDVPTYNLMGVHWRYGGGKRAYRGRRWVILTARARPPVLAHELCHYLGLRHDPAGGNLMTPGPSDPIWRRPGARPAGWKPVLTAAQARKVRAAVRRRGRAARK